jgi:cation diffusion facilitator family transporter
MYRQSQIISNITLACNIFLFFIKTIVGIISNSLALISEAVNSLNDIITSVAIRISVKISSQSPDYNHQFGHHAAQPLACMIIAIFAGVLGITIIQESIKRFLSPPKIIIDFYLYAVLFIAIIIKLSLFFFQKVISKKENSPAIAASGIDSINDVFASLSALLGIYLANYFHPSIDSIAGIIVALFIIKGGYDIAKKNIDYLMHTKASEELIAKIKNEALTTNGVLGVNDLRSHYIGNKLNIEIHIEVNKNITIEKAHNIGKEAQKKIEKIPEINKAFIHIDAIDKTS